MRPIMLAVTIFLLLAVSVAPAFAAGDVSRCYTISNPDARNYCRAKAKATGTKAICATIINADLRAQCQAEVG